MSKLILTHMPVHGAPCLVSALMEENHISEFRLSSESSESLVGNVYIGIVTKVIPNIDAAFLNISPDISCYMSTKNRSSALKPGTELMVQVKRDAMKGKLPFVTEKLEFTGRYFVVSTEAAPIGVSKKLTHEERKRLLSLAEEQKFGSDIPDISIVFRTSSGKASDEMIIEEYIYYRDLIQSLRSYSHTRTCYSRLYVSSDFSVRVLNDTNINMLTEIITDDPSIHKTYRSLLNSRNLSDGILRLYEDKLLPLYKLYRLETAVSEIENRKIWLKSGGFIVIEQTEAFVSIDVNSGKYEGRKSEKDLIARINFEAADEIARQLRLRNLSGIILIDFINMSAEEDNSRLIEHLRSLCRKDPVRTTVVDITGLHILEMTRQKIRRPVIEEIHALTDDHR